jgi:tetratricopeptide (TPR) repeat protein
MALWSEVRNERTKQPGAWDRVLYQALLIPEAVVLVGLLLLAWLLRFPAPIGLLALLPIGVFGLRVLLMTLAERQIALGNYARADRLVGVSLRLNPWSADALALQAQSLAQQGKDAAAEAVLRRAAALYPLDHSLQSSLAAALLAQGRVAEGCVIARQTVASDSPQTAQQHAWIALHIEADAAKACAIIERMKPERLPVPIGLPLLATRAEAQIKANNEIGARTTLELIEQRLEGCPQPQQAELLYHLGRLHNALGDNGATYFRRSVERDPTGRYAQSAWRSAVDAGS